MIRQPNTSRLPRYALALLHVCVLNKDYRASKSLEFHFSARLDVCADRRCSFS